MLKQSASTSSCVRVSWVVASSATVQRKVTVRRFVLQGQCSSALDSVHELNLDLLIWRFWYFFLPQLESVFFLSVIKLLNSSVGDKSNYRRAQSNSNRTDMYNTNCTTCHLMSLCKYTQLYIYIYTNYIEIYQSTAVQSIFICNMTSDKSYNYHRIYYH